MMIVIIIVIMFKIERMVSLTFYMQCGWVIPFIWAGIWALVTTFWVQRSLKHEAAVWKKDRRASYVPVRQAPSCLYRHNNPQGTRSYRAEGLRDGQL